ncbi:uncharacterized protein LOC135941109 [Cloeon dipterum]|uniref:uncharacterized protein LOC135941109 n=1 Tax=Cloeon dipterum TaxID=197152 RepID=UPI0032207A8D
MTSPGVKRRLWVSPREEEKEEEVFCKKVRFNQDPIKSKLDSERIKNIREALGGIPPPPSVTNPRIGIEDAVDRLKQYFESLDEKEIPKVSGRPTQDMDVYYNENLMCETLDFLYEKVRQRYVMNETSSFLSTVAKFSPIESPLSSDFLDIMPRSMSSPSSPAPDMLSIELAQRRGRQPARKTRDSPRKSTMAIRNPNLKMNSVIAQRDAILMRQSIQPQPLKVQPAKSSRMITITRPSKERSKTEAIPKMNELKETHQKKLFWATVQALKNTSPQLMEDSTFFKKCRTSLMRLCLVQWLKQPPQPQGPEQAKGTSDRMLELAMQLAPQVVGSLSAS